MRSAQDATQTSDALMVIGANMLWPSPPTAHSRMRLHRVAASPYNHGCPDYPWTDARAVIHRDSRLSLPPLVIRSFA
jgi:hypothetical protein